MSNITRNSTKAQGEAAPHKKTRMAVVGVSNGRIEVYEAAEYRKPEAGEIIEFEGRYLADSSPSAAP